MSEKAPRAHATRKVLQFRSSVRVVSTEGPTPRSHGHGTDKKFRHWVCRHRFVCQGKKQAAWLSATNVETRMGKPQLFAKQGLKNLGWNARLIIDVPR